MTGSKNKIKEDPDGIAWKRYPKYHDWFNKLWLAERLGYDCGPGGIAPSKSGVYVVRPIYNLYGMGVYTRFQYISSEQNNTVEPGFFWCERFTGDHISVTMSFIHGTKPSWEIHNVWQGFHDDLERPSKFSKWVRLSHDKCPEIPNILKELSAIEKINVEFIGGNLIEVHLRSSFEPDFDEIIPVWTSDYYEKKIKYKDTHTYIEDFDDAGGHMQVARMGFYANDR